MVCGEVGPNGDVISTEAPEPAELWQSPEELRAELRADLMGQVVAEMRASQANWSYTTGLKAMFKTASVKRVSGSNISLQEIVECWARPPICTSVVISFWQRYLVKLSLRIPPPPGVSCLFLEGERVAYWSTAEGNWADGLVIGRNMDRAGNVVSYNLDVVCSVPPACLRRPVLTRLAETMALDLILQYMPLKADRALPGDLLKTLKESEWVPLVQVPRIFRSALVQQLPVLVHCVPPSVAGPAPAVGEDMDSPLAKFCPDGSPVESTEGRSCTATVSSSSPSTASPRLPQAVPRPAVLSDDGPPLSPDQVLRGSREDGGGEGAFCGSLDTFPDRTRRLSMREPLPPPVLGAL